MTSSVHSSTLSAAAQKMLRTREGELVLLQRPNAPLALAIGSAVAALLLRPDSRGFFVRVAYGSMLVWGIGESISGRTPLRRLLGLLAVREAAYRKK